MSTPSTQQEWDALAQYWGYPDAAHTEVGWPAPIAFMFKGRACAKDDWWIGTIAEGEQIIGALKPILHPQGEWYDPYPPPVDVSTLLPNPHP